METTENSATTIANSTFSPPFITTTLKPDNETQSTIADMIKNITNSVLQATEPTSTKIASIAPQDVTTTTVSVFTNVTDGNLTTESVTTSITKALTTVTNVTEKTVTEALNTTVTTTEKIATTVFKVINGTDSTTTEKMSVAGMHGGGEEKTLYIVLGIVLAALFIILIVLIFVYKKYKGRSSSRSGVYSINNEAGSSRYNHNSC